MRRALSTFRFSGALVTTLAGLFGVAHAADEKKGPQPLDVREPPFGADDYAWMNGNNRQPAPLLGVGPVTLSVYADAYFAYQFHDPIDHTIFQTTTAARHDEFSINLAAIGIDVTGLDGPIGRVYVQFGSYVEAIAGQDTTTTRGFFLANRAFYYIQQAAVGWHFHTLHGVNVEAGIFPSYIGMESFLPEENWNYTHAFVSDFTPYYFAGIRTQIYTSQQFKLELWVVNGWQTFGQWHEARAGGYLWNYRPRGGRLSISNAVYVGQEVETDPGGVRVYTDNSVQLQLYRAAKAGTVPKSVALALVADAGYERRSNAPSGPMAASALSGRVEWTGEFASTLRADVAYDETQALVTQFPAGSPYTLNDPTKPKPPFAAMGFATTFDYWPSPWTVFRLEYSHRDATIPYFSGHRGITGPGGVLATDPSTFTPDLRRFDDRVIANATLRL